MLIRVLLTLVKAGVIRPLGPRGLSGTLAGYLQWDITLAWGYRTGAARHPHRAAIIDDDGVLTYAEVDERTSALAHAFHTGERVGLLCRNGRAFVETLTACTKIGADAVLLNTGLSAGQLAQVAREQRIDQLVADREFADVLPDVPTYFSDELDSLILNGPGTPLARRPPRGRLIVLTSGTTGAPKGAHRPEPASLAPAAALLSRIPLRYGDVISITSPLFHTWGLAAFQLSLVLGATLVLRRGFDPAQALKDAERCTAMFVVPVMLQRMLETPHRPKLRVIATSGSALPPKVTTRVLEEFGPVLYNLYGSTEVSWASIATPEEMLKEPGTAGKPPLGTRLAIVDDHGVPVAPGETGRIFVGNDMLFHGYTNGTGKESVDGLMSTGDLGYVKDGLLFVAGRDDEMIVSGGENVYPREVEDLLSTLDGVREVSVTGVPDDNFGQRLAAYVVGDESLTADRIRAHVKANLARFSVPRDVFFLDELPRNAAGKVVKRELREAPARGSGQPPAGS
ncbi:fatty-acyl-CoA synthase [Lentzea fradiae]|uniref:Fatty-acyl-CoA synthase n=1 Tax=Lentzea fradiae TaxID=200378 RepID=A0A1G7SCQ0_9PSEU|nr:AMP-binding protein [Lentzea fradiae]SDG20827.1 fatty-acyl-CoA synthase [Lentzea fradiae]